MQSSKLPCIRAGIEIAGIRSPEDEQRHRNGKRRNDKHSSDSEKCPCLSNLYGLHLMKNYSKEKKLSSHTLDSPDSKHDTMIIVEAVNCAIDRKLRGKMNDT